MFQSFGGFEAYQEGDAELFKQRKYHTKIRFQKSQTAQTLRRNSHYLLPFTFNLAIICMHLRSELTPHNDC